MRFFNLLLGFVVLVGLFTPGLHPTAASLETGASPHPVLSDLRVRQALAHCTDKAALVRAGYPLLTEAQSESLVADSFIHRDHWAYEGDTVKYPYNPSLGADLLQQAGWLLEPGATYRTKDGKELVVKLTTTTAAFRQAWAAALEEQWRACGVRLIRQHSPAQWWFGDRTGLQTRDFEVGAYAWVGQVNPEGRTLYACDQVPYPENNWEGQNYTGWCNPAASQAVIAANQSLYRQEKIDQYSIVQKKLAEDVPVLQLFNRAVFYAGHAALQGFDPLPGEDYYNQGSVEHWLIPGKDTIVWGLTQEPASLFRLLETSFVSGLAYAMVNPPSTYPRGSEIHTDLLTAVPSLENGQVQTETVTVNEGDQVVDFLGGLVELKNGVKYYDHMRQERTYAGGPVQMQRLVTTFTYKPGVLWADGQPLRVEDLQLAYAAQCGTGSWDHSEGFCRYIDTLQFSTSGVGYTVQSYPGQSDFLMFAALGRFPSHQVITSPGPHHNKTLSQVPLQDWSSLPELKEKPLGVGPYQVTQWLFGDRILFSANPHYIGGQPATANIEMRFVAPEQLVNQLFDQEVDLVGSETLFGLTQDLVDGAGTGKIQVWVVPSLTQEHLDFNLETFSTQVDLTENGGGTLQYDGPIGAPVTIQAPAGAVTGDAFSLRYQPLVSSGEEPLEGMEYSRVFFRLEALASGVPQPEGFAFNQPLTITIGTADLGVDPETAALYYWRGSGWADAYLSCPVGRRFKQYDPAAETLTVKVCHLTEFSVMGEPQMHRLMMPLIMR